ncbi:MAG: hypothetical protein ACD_15C00084G0008 [uncultured bacterium]|nr:MAG: hypothetical protein ACD_15C00084G0008 [uncultured bacterium]
MDNKKISTSLGTVLIIIFAATALAFVLMYENKRRANEVQSDSVKVVENNKINNKGSIQDNQSQQSENTQDLQTTNKEQSSPDGWNTFESNISNSVFTTNDWDMFNATNSNAGYLFRLHYPNDWKLEGSVFYDKNDNKISEFMPLGVILLEDNQHCFDGKFTTSFSNLIQLISQESFKIADVKGIKRISKAPVSGSSKIWYPNSYCVEENGKAVIINFYENNSSSPNKNIFEKIISTLSFEDQSDKIKTSKYINKTFGYEFEYPDKLKTTSISNDSNVVISDGLEGHWIYNINTQANYQKLSLEDAFSQILTEKTKSVSDKNLINISSITIDGKLAKKYSIKNYTDYGNTGIVLISGDYIISIFGDNSISPINSDLENILNSFKFIY